MAIAWMPFARTLYFRSQEKLKVQFLYYTYSPYVVVCFCEMNGMTRHSLIIGNDLIWNIITPRLIVLIDWLIDSQLYLYRLWFDSSLTGGGNNKQHHRIESVQTIVDRIESINQSINSSDWDDKKTCVVVAVVLKLIDLSVSCMTQ